MACLPRRHAARLVAVKYSGVTIIENTYDGLNRRIKKVDKTGDPDVEYSYYYNTSWQVLEVRHKAGTNDPTVHKQFVWDLRYIDAPVLRDRDADGDSQTGDYGKTGSGLEERLYYTNDANMNPDGTSQTLSVTALVKTAGAVVERYSYDPYGRVTARHGVIDAAGQDTSADEWSERTAGTFENNILYAGYVWDPKVGLFHVRNRTYHPTLGRWLQRDPLGYVDGMSLYAYVNSHPTRAVDSTGLSEDANGCYEAEKQAAQRCKDAYERDLKACDEDLEREVGPDVNAGGMSSARWASFSDHPAAGDYKACARKAYEAFEDCMEAVDIEKASTPCCDGVPYDRDEKICCLGKLYDRSEYTCCDSAGQPGNWYPLWQILEYDTIHHCICDLYSGTPYVGIAAHAVGAVCPPAYVAAGIIHGAGSYRTCSSMTCLCDDAAP